MGDQGQWWRGISNMIKEKGGIPFSELDTRKKQVIDGVKLAVASEEWDDASRLAKNVVIYDKLIELNRYIMEADVISIAESISPTLDGEFDPLVKANNEEGIKLAIEKYIPGLVGGGKSRKRKSRNRKSRKRKSRKGKSRKGKSRKRKSRGRKSKRRNR